MKNRISVKSRPDGANCRIVEFMVAGPDVKDRAQGALIAITLREDGSVDVDTFKADPAVYVRVARRHAAGHR
jgi:hypothetical protein